MRQPIPRGDAEGWVSVMDAALERLREVLEGEIHTLRSPLEPPWLDGRESDEFTVNVKNLDAEERLLLVARLAVDVASAWEYAAVLVRDAWREGA